MKPSRGRYPKQLDVRHNPAFRDAHVLGQRNPLVLVAMPMYKYPNPKTIVCMDITRQHLGRHYPGVKLAVQTPTSTGIVQARTKLVESIFKQKEVTHLFMVDDDMRWPLGGDDEEDSFNPIARLLSVDKDVVGGLAFTRHQPLRPFIGEHIPETGWGRVMNDVPDENKMRAGQPFPVDYIGFGMVMIKRAAILKVAELVGIKCDDEGNVVEGVAESVFTSECNWWERPGAKAEIRAHLEKVYPIGATLAIGAMDEAWDRKVMELVELVDRLHWKAKTFGEDWSFCKKARRAGCDVWVDPSFELGHYGDYSYSIRDFLAQMELARHMVEQGEEPLIEVVR